MSKKDKKTTEINAKKGDYRCLFCGNFANIEVRYKGSKTVLLSCGHVIAGKDYQKLMDTKI